MMGTDPYPFPDAPFVTDTLPILSFLPDPIRIGSRSCLSLNIYICIDFIVEWLMSQPSIYRTIIQIHVQGWHF